MLTAYIPRPQEFGPNTQIDDKTEDYIDIVAKDIIDLATKLDKLRD